MKPQFQPMMKQIVLPNSEKHRGLSQDKKKRINLPKLHNKFMVEGLFKSDYDKDSNPFCNYVELTFVGKARIFSNGTITTNLNFPDEELLLLFERLYNITIKDCLEG